MNDQYKSGRIDLIITELNVGGAEKCLTDLACFLAQKGIAVRVVSIASLPGVNQDEFVQRLRSQGVQVDSLNCNRVWDFGKAVSKYRQLLKCKTPDIVQSFLFHANLVAATACLGMKRGRSPEHNKQRKKVRWVAGVRVADPRNSRLAAESLAFRMADRVVAVSAGAREVYRRYCDIESAKWIVIANGVEVAQDVVHQPHVWEWFGIPGDASVALFVGRLDEQKGVVWLVDTASSWLTELPHYHLVLMGRGPLESQIRESIQAIAEQSPAVASRIHCVGWVSNPRFWMGLSKMLLLPASYEGMPNVCLEAMAESLPVVAFDVQGIRELLGHQASSQVVPLRNDSKWKEAICLLARDEQLRKDIGLQNRRLAERDFGLPAQLEKYWQLYLELMAD